MRTSVPPDADLTVSRNNISAAALSPKSADLSDVILFNDSECEEITENDLMFGYNVESDSGENSCRNATEKNLEPLSSESMEAGLDSALGRSVSNPSLHTDVRCPAPTLLVSDAEPHAKLCHADVGYSSEGHSNEEPAAGKRGLGPSVASGATVDEELTMDNLRPGSASSSGIGTNTVHRVTDASGREPQLRIAVHREAVGEETDDDFSRLNELPLDEVPSASELDLLEELAKVSDNNRLMRLHGRSLDSLAPLGSDKLFTGEKRVSSVEIIVDSVASSSRPSFSSQMSRDSDEDENVPGDMMIGRSLLPGSHKFSASSSCDASSEGTLSDFELSDLGSGELTGSPKKSRILANRVRRSLRSSLTLHSGTSIKSPTKRRMENLLESPTAGNHMVRSTSDSTINRCRQQDCSEVKRSRICQSLTDLQDGLCLKKSTVGRGCRSNLISPKKVSVRRSAHKLNFDDDCKAASKTQHCDQQSLGMYISVVLSYCAQFSP